MDVTEMRREYPEKPIRKNEMRSDPMDQFDFWLTEALNIKTIEVNAMTLATATKDGKPSCRTVLLKQYDASGFIFYTNFESRKAKEISENPHAMVTFFWHEQMRQICIEGAIEKISDKESAEYFARRPRGSQVGAWASPQDQVIENREILDKAFQRIEKQYEGQEIPLPPFWGGYRIKPDRIEFWQGHKNRLHDRFEYLKKQNVWILRRLAP